MHILRSIVLNAKIVLKYIHCIIMTLKYFDNDYACHLARIYSTSYRSTVYQIMQFNLCSGTYTFLGTKLLSNIIQCLVNEAVLVPGLHTACSVLT